LPDLPGKDDRRPLRAPAERADRAPRQVERGARVIVVSGPSGAGKGTLIRGLLERVAGVATAVSATTRAAREGERDGREYHFLGRDEFLDRVERDEFLEYAEYAGHLYGTLRSEVGRHIEAGRSVVLEIELQGARQVRAREPRALFVFIAPPSFAELERRLTGRGTEREDEILLRLSAAADELGSRDEFEYVIINDEVPRATAELVDAVVVETSALPREGE
jgi:guanylate kinase